ncbi:MAG: hypothetical protein AB1801_19535 [Chloroflexota bacterium]
MMKAKNSPHVKKVIENVAGIFLNRFNRPGIPATLNYHPPVEVASLSTGLRPLDKALEIGGLPYQQITELISPSATMGGATAIAARIAARAQRKQQMVSIIDMNHTFDPWLAERAGLIAPHLLLARPGTVFEALTTLERAARHEEGLIIVVLGMVTELFNQADVALLTQLLSRVRTIVKQSDRVFLFMTAALQNDPFNLANYPAGFPLAELADIRLWIQDECWSHKDGLATAYKANVTVIKNRLAMAGKGASLNLKFAPLEPNAA